MSATTAVVSRRLIHSIERYQAAAKVRGWKSGCRFTPSCSTYALEALRSRRAPVAIAMIVWRILRCNPLTHHRHHDPMKRARRFRTRPNTVQTLSAFLAGTGLVLIVGSAALGQSLSGGCQGSVNGAQPSSLTDDRPLVVGKGETITINGTAPAGKTAGGSVNGDYSISIIEGLFKVDRRNQNWTGKGGDFRGNVNVDDYLKFGSGLYKVDGVATPSGGGWRCRATFYVRLDGSKVIGLVGAGLGVIGAGGTLAAGRSKRKLAEYQPAPASESETAAASLVESGEDTVNEIRQGMLPDPLATAGADAGWACLIALLAVLTGSIFGGYVVPVAMTPAAGSTKRVWVKGRPVLGFFSGLIGGLGATIALQQFGFWPLTIANAIGFPLAIAVLSALRGWRGSAYKVG